MRIELSSEALDDGDRDDDVDERRIEFNFVSVTEGQELGDELGDA